MSLKFPNIIELFPKEYVMEFELSFDPKEIVQKLNPYMSDTTTSFVEEPNNVQVDYTNPLAGGIEINDDCSGLAGSSHSAFGTILKEKEFLSLKDEVLYCTEEYIKKFNICPSKIIKVTNSWCNVMPRGSTLKFHMHVGSLLSGVYYPLLPEDAMHLSILNPTQSSKSNYPNSKDDIRERRMLPTKEGHLYIFPSYFEHGSIEPNNCDKRISINFNTLAY